MAKKVIFSQKLAGILMQRGFVLQALEKSDVVPSKNVFVFKDSEEINRVIEEFKIK